MATRLQLVLTWCHAATAAFVLLGTETGRAQSSAAIERAIAFSKEIEGKLYRASFDVHWMGGTPKLWYRVLTAPSTYEYVVVDATTGEMRRASSLPALGIPWPSRATSQASLEIHRSSRNREPTQIRFVNHLEQAVELFWVDTEGQRISYGLLQPGQVREQSTFQGHVWLVADRHQDALAVMEATADPLDVLIDAKAKRAPDPKPSLPNVSPDGRWGVTFEKNEIVLRDIGSGDTKALTTDGTVARGYRGPVQWSPNSEAFVALLVRNAPMRKLTLVDSSPTAQLQPKVLTIDYQKPGDELPTPQPVLVRLADLKPVTITNELFPVPFTPSGKLAVRWSPNGKEFTFDYNQRGHQLWRILAVDTDSAAVRTVLEERAATFIDYTR